MSKTKEDNLNQFKGLQQVQAIKQELKHKYLQICSKNYNDRELIIDCMYNNLKNEERQLNDLILKIDAHAKFYEATKESLNKEEQQTQLLITKKLVNEWMEWERSGQKYN
ncbi:unnamed protein product (macronuclear) [Paramecium tetraurelia]|uniref:Uncharacterized protein n=1 Tax=Paramecium tetraurelia TaxID=5888 RepID=A0C4A3_PARTE|nr:uncharacterized protein GSPATT00035100001 [Paramecium tetraurelia]CAK65620.1 unnamed protein product [Paramecium tetraurelia]|eukprot:XP_001433017.1 hypothetical protein (macronuclear) [Paramecium tetraurelia strain d4-2]